MRKQRETDQTDGTARRGRREYVRGAVLRGDPIQLGHVSGDTEGDTRGRHTSFSQEATGRRGSGARHVSASVTAAADPGLHVRIRFSLPVFPYPSTHQTRSNFFFFSGQKIPPLNSQDRPRLRRSPPGGSGHAEPELHRPPRGALPRDRAQAAEGTVPAAAASEIRTPARGARCCDFVRCRFSCPGLLGLLNFSSNLCSSRAIEA